MSPLQSPPLQLESLAACPLPAEVLDDLDRAVHAARNRSGRAAVLRSLVYEMYDSIAWLGRSDLAADELRSLQQVLDATDAHQARQTRADLPDQQLPLDSVA